MTEMETQERTLTGIGASPGICIGKAYLVDAEGVDVVKQYRIDPEHVECEKRRFKAAVKNARSELQAILKSGPGDQRAQEAILETHEILLKDKMLYGSTIEAIEKTRVNAEWALKEVVAHLKSMFQEMEDTYLKDRAFDIVQVSDRIMRHLVGVNHVNIGQISKRVILVARDLSPAETSQIQLERIKGFVTDLGGRTSHTSIVARSLGIPAVMGVGTASATIRDNDLLIVDGVTGKVVVNPTEATLLEFEERRQRYEEYKAEITRQSQNPATTLDGTPIKIFGNIELPEEVVQVLDNGGEGIGLFRTEFQYLNRSTFPTEEELFDHYMDVVHVMKGRPVTIRTLDINGDKTISGRSSSIETNPALGLRAIRYCLRNPEIFKTQLRAILKASAAGPVRILFPMISGHDEILEARKTLRETEASLQSEGIGLALDYTVGVMIEVPSAVILADVIAKEVDFFSIGTNDLIQYTLAIDRGNQEVAYLYQPLHPAVLRMLKRTADVARENGIRYFMCGEMAGDPLCIPILLGLGLDELSMTPQSIPVIKRLIRAISLPTARQLVADALKETSARAVVALTQEAFGDVFQREIYHNGPESFCEPAGQPPATPPDSVPTATFRRF